MEHIAWLHELGMEDLGRVGGKNASLGEMIAQLADLGIEVPGGFATTAHAYREFLEQSGLKAKIDSTLAALDVDDVNELARTGAKIRGWIMDTPFTATLNEAIDKAWAELTERSGKEPEVAVRSSATAEDLPDASFAGQQETFLNVTGLEEVRQKIHEVFASLYNDRAIAYRVHHGFDHAEVYLSAGIQLMVRSDLASSGVIFTLDTESGFRDAVFITAAYGLGETVVQGAVNPDEFYVSKTSLNKGKRAVLRRNRGSKAIQMVFGDGGKGVLTIDTPEEDQQRFCVTDEEVESLARMAVTIENHYGRPMDIEWAKDGVNGRLYIVQARPETVRSQSTGQSLERYELLGSGPRLAEGRSIGHKIGAGTSKVIMSLREMDRVKPGDVLITDMTDPDWEPIMKRAAAIVTNRGGRTCHAAIIARELGIPAVVGCRDATDSITDNIPVTVCCAEGDAGYVYDGELEYRVQHDDLAELPEAPLKVMMNVGNPDRAFDFAMIPNRGVGLARLEFIINRMIGIHPRALLEYDEQDAETRAEIDRHMGGYPNPVDFYVMRLAEGIATIAAGFVDYPVIVRLSDFKTNEYANLIGGQRYEPKEENPMLGFRGASRYVSDEFRDCFELECRALKYVREEMGMTNVWAMIPFVRTLEEGTAVLETMEQFGLKQGENDLKVIMMCELPSNALLADKFLDHFDGFSIGSNDLTQLVLGLDRDSALIADKFDERNPAVLEMLSMAIRACRARGKYIGICGQGPSDHPDLAQWLVDQGIESISLNPDTVVETWLALAKEDAKAA